MKQELMKVINQRQLAPRIYELTVKGELVNEMNSPGQFLHVRVPRADLLLRRPISINQIDHEHKTCRNYLSNRRRRDKDLLRIEHGRYTRCVRSFRQWV